MAARRLLIVLLILLGLSTLAAALVPPQALREESTTTETTETMEQARTVPPDTLPRGKELQARIRVGGSTIPVVPIEAGDQLSLLVRSKRPGELEMPAFGLVDAVGPDQPAQFEILPREAGSYGVRFVPSRRVAARVAVEKPGARKREAKKKEASSRARGGRDRA
jgi:hypothetical protein